MCECYLSCLISANIAQLKNFSPCYICNTFSIQLSQSAHLIREYFLIKKAILVFVFSNDSFVNLIENILYKMPIVTVMNKLKGSIKGRDREKVNGKETSNMCHKSVKPLFNMAVLCFNSSEKMFII